MPRVLFLSVMLLLVNVASAAALPPCPTGPSAYFHNCEGIYTWADGRKYVGEWRDDLPNGQGTFTFANGDKYVGDFRDALPNGQGTSMCPKGADVRQGPGQSLVT